MHRTISLCAFLAFLLGTIPQASAVTTPPEWAEEHREKNTAPPPHTRPQVVGLEKTLRVIEKNLGDSKVARKTVKALRESLKKFSVQSPAHNDYLGRPDLQLEIRWTPLRR